MLKKGIIFTTLGIKSYHQFAKDELQSNHPKAALPPPVEISLNKHNIKHAQTAILDAYRYDQEDSIHQVVKKSPYWSLMHDGISKFSTEYNGVYVRGIDESNEPVNVPYCLTKMKGGVDAYDTGKKKQILCDALFTSNLLRNFL